MTRTRPFAEIAARGTPDPTRQTRLNEHRRAIDDALILAQLQDEAVAKSSGEEAVIDLPERAESPHGPGDDPYLIALHRYVADLGGDLVVEAVFPGLRVNLLRSAPPLAEEDDLPEVTELHASSQR